MPKSEGDSSKVILGAGVKRPSPSVEAPGPGCSGPESKKSKAEGLLLKKKKKNPVLVKKNCLEENDEESPTSKPKPPTLNLNPNWRRIRRTSTML